MEDILKLLQRLDRLLLSTLKAVNSPCFFLLALDSDDLRLSPGPVAALVRRNMNSSCSTRILSSTRGGAMITATTCASATG